MYVQLGMLKALWLTPTKSMLEFEIKEVFNFFSKSIAFEQQLPLQNTEKRAGNIFLSSKHSPPTRFQVQKKRLTLLLICCEQWPPCSYVYCRQIARYQCFCLSQRRRLIWVKFVKIPKQKFEIQLTVHLFSYKARCFSLSEYTLFGNFIIKIFEKIQNC